MKCCTLVGTTERGKPITCDRVAHRQVGRKGFCDLHKNEAFTEQSKKRKRESIEQRAKEGRIRDEELN